VLELPAAEIRKITGPYCTAEIAWFRVKLLQGLNKSPSDNHPIRCGGQGHAIHVMVVFSSTTMDRMLDVSPV
jgi:hypothetical protein